MKKEITNVPAELALSLLGLLPEGATGANQLLKRAGILGGIDENGRLAVASVSRGQFAALFREVFWQLKKADADTTSELWLEPEEFRMFCYCIIHHKTLRGAFEQASQFFRMIQREDAVLIPDSEPGMCRLDYRLLATTSTVSALFCDLLSLSYFFRLFSWLIGESIEIDGLHTRHRNPLESPILSEVFQLPIFYDQGGNYFLFSMETLDKPVVRTADDLDTLFEMNIFPFDLLSTGSSDVLLSELVASHYRGFLHKGKALPSLEQLAFHYNMSESTLRRRLAEEGASISSIKDQCRIEMAQELLVGSTRSIDDIAARLGFSDAGALRRAFKKWEGVTPAQYRQSVAHT